MIACSMSSFALLQITPVLTPRGRLVLANDAEPPGVDPQVGRRLLDAFESGSGAGLLHLGAVEVGTPLPAVFVYWRDFAAIRPRPTWWGQDQQAGSQLRHRQEPGRAGNRRSL
jgi:hypothetical protein